MSCSSIKKLLAGFVDDSLGDDERMSVEKHISSCPSCSKNLEELKKTMTLVHTLKEVEPPPWYTQKIMSQVRQESTAKGILDNIRDYFTFKTRIVVLATFFIAFFAVFLYRAILPEPDHLDLESHQSMVDVGSRQGSSVDDKRMHVSPENNGSQSGRSGMKEDKQAGEKIAHKPAHEPFLQGKGYSGAAEHIADKSSGSEKQGSLPIPSVGQEKEGKSSPQQSAEPLLTEAASKRSALNMPYPVEISLAVSDLATSSTEVDSILKKLNIKITRYQVLESSELYNAEVKSQDLKTLIDLLKKMGDLKSKNIPTYLGTDIVNVTIAIKSSR